MTNTKYSSIQKIYTFIDFLASIENDCIKKNPLIEEFLELDKQRNQLNPDKKFTDKQKYNKIQFEIEAKLDDVKPICSAISNKLIELNLLEKEDKLKNIKINRNDILEFKKTATEEQAKLTLAYFKKYTSFRQNTNIYVFCSLIFNNLDIVLKDLYNYFNDSKKDDFVVFEQQTIKCDSIEEVAKKMCADFKNGKKNVNYSILTFSQQLQKQPQSNNSQKNNIFIMENNSQNINVSDNAKVENIVGRQKNVVNKTETSDKESKRINKKVLCWTIVGVLVAVIGILMTTLIK
jgi:hypothetical protein